jgi:hypothetical protein
VSDDALRTDIALLRAALDRLYKASGASTLQQMEDMLTTLRPGPSAFVPIAQQLLSLNERCRLLEARLDGVAFSRHVDEIDAMGEAAAWLRLLTPLDQPARIEVLEFQGRDGRCQVLWVGGKPAAVALAVRDDFNFTVLVKWRP